MSLLRKTAGILGVLGMVVMGFHFFVQELPESLITFLGAGLFLVWGLFLLLEDRRRIWGTLALMTSVIFFADFFFIL
ncbi:hypothetical protein [Halobacillus salinus]|uniref:hypothetical protein n=1 Tax=Halobacillus salinus TaxID=192814 RepID=UPI0009A5B780|nr:hypothetical protein [Halobacillus salinus]